MKMKSMNKHGPHKTENFILVKLQFHIHIAILQPTFVLQMHCNEFLYKDFTLNTDMLTWVHSN